MGKYSFAIGLNYKGTQSELPDCELDANSITDSLSVVSSRVANSATPETLLSAVGSYRTLLRTDTLIFYYSGHGTLLPGGRGSLCLHDGKQMQYFPTDLLITKLSELPCNVVLILDCCYAAAGFSRTVLPLQYQIRSIPYSSEFPTFELPPSRNVYAVQSTMVEIAACENDQVSYSTGSGGAFTLAFMAARYQKLFFGLYLRYYTKVTTKTAIALTKLASRALTLQKPVFRGTKDVAIY